MTQKPSQMPKNNTHSTMTMTNPLDYLLCYIDNRDGLAWFTSIPLELQWGDDWNDAPYEHNAGEPYNTHYPNPDKKDERVEHELVRVAFVSNLDTPCNKHFNSPWSVQQINARHTPWLTPPSWYKNEFRPIFAGVTLAEFIKEIEASEGEVFLPRSLWKSIENTTRSSEVFEYP